MQEAILLPAGRRGLQAWIVGHCDDHYNRTICSIQDSVYFTSSSGKTTHNPFGREDLAAGRRRLRPRFQLARFGENACTFGDEDSSSKNTCTFGN